TVAAIRTGRRLDRGAGVGSSICTASERLTIAPHALRFPAGPPCAIDLRLRDRFHHRRAAPSQPFERASGFRDRVCAIMRSMTGGLLQPGDPRSTVGRFRGAREAIEQVRCEALVSEPVLVEALAKLGGQRHAAEEEAIERA